MAERARSTRSTPKPVVKEPIMEETPVEASVEATLSMLPPPLMVTVGNNVHFNGLAYDVPGSVYTWRAISPTYHWVAMLNADKAGASFVAEEEGMYHIYIDTVNGVEGIDVVAMP